jgi:hypothetical protein
MYVTYLMIFFSLSLFGQPGQVIKEALPPKTIEDFEHQFKGCLENSHCDEIMGKQLSTWKHFLSELRNQTVSSKEKHQRLDDFRSKNGIPVEFYTTEKSQLGFKPLLFHSACKNHNPEKGVKIQRGLSFIKSISQEKGVLWRDQTQIEVPVGEIFHPQMVTVFFDEKKINYLIPLDDQPLYVKDKSLYLLKEDQEVFYVLKISPEGEWRIIDTNLNQVTQWSEKRKVIECPKSLPQTNREIFQNDVCHEIWNEDQKKLIPVIMQRGCAT